MIRVRFVVVPDETVGAMNRDNNTKLKRSVEVLDIKLPDYKSFCSWTILAHHRKITSRLRARIIVFTTLMLRI